MSFEEGKQHTMGKYKNAKKEKLVDKMLIPFLDKYNKKKDTYTTSSCAGRVLLLGLDTEEQKKPKLFVGKWHRTIKLKEAIALLGNNKFDEIWLKQEPFIMHIVAKSLEKADQILKIKQECGIKRGGILYIKKDKFIIELMGSSYMAVPIKMGNDILFNKRQLGILVNKANKKIKKNYLQLRKLLKGLQKDVKIISNKKTTKTKKIIKIKLNKKIRLEIEDLLYGFKHYKELEPNKKRIEALEKVSKLWNNKIIKEMLDLMKDGHGIKSNSKRIKILEKIFKESKI
jgi:tRNA wybutosine-synthesizing protein 3